MGSAVVVINAMTYVLLQNEEFHSVVQVAVSKRMEQCRPAPRNRMPIIQDKACGADPSPLLQEARGLLLHVEGAMLGLAFST